MRVDDITVEVRDKQLARVGVILPEDLDLEVADLHNSIGNWTVRLPMEHPMSAALRTPGSGILVRAGQLEFSGRTIQPDYSSSADDAKGTVVVKGVCDKVILADSLAYPQPSNSDPSTQEVAKDEATFVAESLMYWYVDRNIGPGGSTARRNPHLTMGDNLQRGTEMTKRPRFQVLGELLNEICAIDGMGYRVIQRGSSLVFETYQAEDRRLSVRLSTFNGELNGQRVATSAPGATRAIVGGRGDGAGRKFVEVTTDDSLSAEESWGRRIEAFVSEGSSNLTSDLVKAGQELLAEQGFGFVSVQAMPSEDTSLIFGVDWGLGDLVTIEVDGVESTSIVRGYVLKANSDGVLLGAVLGNEDDFTEAGSTQRQLAGVARQVSALERTVETAAWRSYLPTLSADGGAFYSAVRSGRFSVSGDTCTFSSQVVINDAGDASGSLRIGLPVPLAPGAMLTVLQASENQSTGELLRATASGSIATVRTASNLSPIANARTINVSGSYEVAA